MASLECALEFPSRKPNILLRAAADLPSGGLGDPSDLSLRNTVAGEQVKTSLGSWRLDRYTGEVTVGQAC